MRISRVAALYDIHGNLPALEAVLADVEALAPDVVVVGGDVAAGPMPVEVLDLLMGLGDRARFVRGNADREVVEAFDHGRPATAFSEAADRGVSWASRQITKGHRDFLDAFEDTVALDVTGLGPTLFCHGSPRSDQESVMRVTSDDRLRAILLEIEQDVVICGHTHAQFDRRLHGHRVVNAGSVGMPYEGIPGAFWLAVHEGEVELRRTDYDIGRAADTMRASDFPDLDEMLGESLLEPVDANWVAEFFEARATGREPPPPPGSAT